MIRTASRTGLHAVVQAVGLGVTIGMVTGCSTLSSINPVNWWHRQEGGKIAQQRPAPPGADAPYPNLATVPAKPTPPDAEAMQKLTDSLIADRTNAQHAAQATPLTDPSSPTASPGLFGVGTAPPPGPAVASAAPTNAKAPAGADAPSTSASAGAAPTASASMPAVNTPPAAPASAPRRPVQSAQLAPQAATPDPAASPAPPPAQAPAPAVVPAPAAVAPEVLPDLPAGPPGRPGAAGAPPPPVAAPVPMPAQAAGVATATIVFVEGSTSLAAPGADEVKSFAGKRGNGVIVVTGFGDAASSDPTAQSAAVVLGLARAQAVADALKQAGVPGNAIRVSAEASGRGASLRLIQ